MISLLVHREIANIHRRQKFYTVNRHKEYTTKKKSCKKVHISSKLRKTGVDYFMYVHNIMIKGVIETAAQYADWFCLVDFLQIHHSNN